LDQALAALENEELDIVKEYASCSEGAGMTLDATYRAAENKRKDYENKAFVWTVRGRKIELRVLANNVVKFIDKFKDVGDLLSSLDPIHAGLPWAGIKILLEVCRGPSELTSLMQCSFLWLPIA
jgi:hypothetical protein